MFEEIIIIVSISGGYSYMKHNNFIEFKGTKDGLIVYLNEAYDFDTIKSKLIEKLEKTKNFFSGARVVSIEGKSLSINEENEIVNLMNDRYGMIILKKDALIKPEKKFFKGIDEGITKFIKSTIRSGTKIEFKGNIIILGDVNPGAEIIAYGNIVVMGALRGIAHAGSNGNESAFVSALKLFPTQLRIGKYIARSPDSTEFNPKYPEIAYVKDDIIVIEPYLTKNI